MITKFLYQLDETKRKIITAVIEDQEEGELPLSYPLVEQSKYIENENETVFSYEGEMVYVVLVSEGQKKYLDVSLDKTDVKVKLTDKINYATCISKHMAEAILYNYDYFGLDECKFISSGFFRTKYGEQKDKLDGFFRKANDDSHCQIMKNNKVYFVAKDENKDYYLTTEFSKATRITKNNVRKVLTMYNLIDDSTQRPDLSFSKFNCFVSPDAYFYAGNEPIRVNYDKEQLVIDTSSSDVTIADRLANDENAYKILRNLYFKINQPITNKMYYLRFNNFFIQKTLTGFKYVNNPADATLLDNKDIEIFLMAISLFIDPKGYKRFKEEDKFLYYVDDNTFRFQDNPDSSYNSGLLVDINSLDKYKSIFSKNIKYNLSGFIVIKDSKYLKLEIIDDTSFKVYWLNDAYESTVLTDEQISLLVLIFGWDIQKRDVRNLITNNKTDIYNLDYNNPKDNIIEEYEKILSTIVNNKHKICSFFAPSLIKIESEKGALEYLRRFYLKEVYDAKKLFDITLSNYDFIKNILIVGPGAHLNLSALSLTLNEIDKKVNVSTIDTSKWGYYPKVNLSSNIIYQSAYRFEFSSLIKSLSDYDMIFFTKGFNEDESSISPILDFIIEDSKKIVIVNTMFCNVEKQKDFVYAYLKNKISISRKLFNHQQEQFTMGISINNDYIKKLRGVCHCFKEACDVCDITTSNENSYLSILIKDDLGVKDHYKKSKK